MQNLIEPPLPKERGTGKDGIYNTAEFQTSHEEIRQHIFRYRWLKTILTAQEHQAIYDLEISLLRNLYPYIYEGGPEGPAQHINIQNMLNILTPANTDAENFAEDFMRTYADIRDQIRNNQQTYDDYIKTWYLTTNHIKPDTDGWAGDLKDLHGSLYNVRNNQIVTSAAFSFFTVAFDTRVTLINFATAMRTDPHMHDIITTHDAFTKKYGLD